MGLNKPRVFGPADILLPKNADMEKWSVIACDQHTSEPEYWERVDRFVGNSPSTLRLMLPEHLYSSERLSELIEATRKTMDDYLEGGIFREIPNSYVYIERTSYSGKLRRGLLGQIDLEHYDHSDKSEALLRATEGVVEEKMPPRIKLREGARAELTHVMVLVDDPERMIIEPLEKMKASMEVLYDFDLMENGGHITGYRVHREGADGIDKAVDMLCDLRDFSRRHNCQEKPVLLFATGDGNHSLATAKACWDNMKNELSQEERNNHPARSALVEVVNIWDEALEFEPINRVVFDCDPDFLLSELLRFYPGSKIGSADGYNIHYYSKNSRGILSIPEEAAPLAVGALGNFLDFYFQNNAGRVDFIHGDDVVERLSRQKNTIGFVLPAIEKGSFFSTIIEGGAMPRKTFSMGDARDKRYYLECRRLEID